MIDTNLSSLALVRARSRSRLTLVSCFFFSLASRYLAWKTRVSLCFRYPLVCDFHFQQGGPHLGQPASFSSLEAPSRFVCGLQGRFFTDYFTPSIGSKSIIDLLRFLTPWFPSSYSVSRPTVKSPPRTPSSRCATIWSRTSVFSLVSLPRSLSCARWWDRPSSSRTAPTEFR